ncbi:hydroxyisourate hydrolase [Streptomyces sp. NPDC053048]|uniref:hydroxyisourate hydrolase n=1 Tax=Streptomyces sp. NPDC053048 TaxID=3365694 RepID=UPI0037D24C17
MTGSTTTVSTHVLDTGAGRPADGVGVELAVRQGADGDWSLLAARWTDAEGRCAGFPALPPHTAQARLRFVVGPYLRPDPAEGGAAFFPEAAVTFAVEPGEHYHVPLLLSPFGYSVYRGS